MNRLSAFLTAAIVVGMSMAACASLVPAEPAGSPTQTAAPTQPGPTTALPPTASADPTPTPPAGSLPGTAVSFDRLSMVVPAGVAASATGTLVPEATGDSVAPWDVAPQHIRLALEGYALQEKFHQPAVYVYPAQAYAELQERGSAAQSLERLRAVLAQGAMVNVKELPEIPFFNISQAMAAQVKVIPFQNGRGVRMLTEYAMARAIINNHELIYHFEGLTGDGQFYVIAILPVTAPGLPEDGQPGSAVPPGGVTVPDYHDMNANWLGYYGEVRQMLQGLEPGAYTPDLDQLDAMIGSLIINTSD